LLFAAAVLNATDRGIFAIAMAAIKHTYSFTGGSWRPTALRAQRPLCGISMAGWQEPYRL
jgi:hypothetical protein